MKTDHTPALISSRARRLTLLAGSLICLSAAFAAEPAKKNALDETEPPATGEEAKVVLDKFEVFGRKSINADLPRSRDDVQPYVVFGHEQLASAPAANLEEFLRTRLPMNQGFGPGSQSGASNASSINLRGLESNQTLILLDGRRLPPRATGGGNSLQADINGIPLSMIERVEILPSTASGIYGGGATGGVINIITRKDFSGVEVALSYGSPFHTDAATRRADLNGSFSLEGGKTFLTFGVSHTDGTQMLVQDNDLQARGVALQLANNPAAILADYYPFAGYTTNIRSQDGSNLVLKSGRALNAAITSVPVGYAGPASDGGAALAANAGHYNLAMPNTRLGGLGGRVNAPTVDSLTLSARRSFGKRVETYVDVSRYRNRGESYLSPGSYTATSTLPASAPNNPFTTDINVAFPLTNLPGGLQTTESRSERLAGGVVVKLPGEWSAGLDYVWSRSLNSNRAPSGLLGDPDGWAGPGLSFAEAVAGGMLNVMRDLNASPLNYTPYLNPAPWFQQKSYFKSAEYTLRVTGPVLQLPAGAVTVSASAQVRDDEIPDSVMTDPTDTAPPMYYWSPRVAMHARAYYAETKVPVFSEQASGWLRDFALQLSVRRDETTAHARADGDTLFATGPDGPFPAGVAYRDKHFTATKLTAGFKYSPTKDLAVRASWGTGYLAPSLFQLKPGAGFPLDFPVTDPKRGGAPGMASFTLIYGGNANLRPEESKSLSAGIVYTPRWLPRFRLSIDLTQIEKSDEITDQIFIQDILKAEDALPGRVTRAALTAADRALGYTGGVITQIDTSAVNVARKRLRAYDAQLDYSLAPHAWGNLQLYAIGTYQPEYATALLPSDPLTNLAGGQGTGGIWVKWKANGGLNLTKGSWTLGWNTQYCGPHLGYFSITPEIDATAILNQGNNGVVPAQIYHDISLGYNTGPKHAGWRSLVANSQITVGVQDVFNTRPPVLATAYWNGPSFDNLGDARLARYTLTVRKRF